MATLLSLPGELRNYIYDLCLFPEHKTVSISNVTLPWDLVKSPFNSPILRVSQQIRAEAFARLCSTKKLRILGLPSANLVFYHLDTIIEANLVNIHIAFNDFTEFGSIAAVYFFTSLAKMKALKKLSLELPSFPTKLSISGEPVCIKLPDYAFFVKLKEMVKERGMEFTWLAGRMKGGHVWDAFLDKLVMLFGKNDEPLSPLQM